MLMTTVFRWLAAWPLPLLHALGWLGGWLAWLTSPAYRRRWAHNAALAGVGWRARLASIGEAGKLSAELPRLWLGKPVPWRWDGVEHVDAARAAGQGLLFLTPHMGCFEITAQAYAAQFGTGPAPKPMTVLYRPPRQPWLRELVESSRARPGLATAPTLTTPDPIEIHAHLAELKHAGIEQQLRDEMRRPLPDLSLVQTLKKRKLRIKEELSIT